MPIMEMDSECRRRAQRCRYGGRTGVTSDNRSSKIKGNVSTVLKRVGGGECVCMCVYGFLPPCCILFRVSGFGVFFRMHNCENCTGVGEHRH